MVSMPRVDEHHQCGALNGKASRQFDDKGLPYWDTRPQRHRIWQNSRRPSDGRGVGSGGPFVIAVDLL